MLTPIVRNCLLPVLALTLSACTASGPELDDEPAALREQIRASGFVPESEYANSYYLAMHAGPDGNANWNIDTADKVFEKYFIAGQ